MGKEQEGNAAGLFKIELNEQGDYVTVPTGNDAFFDSFADGCRKLYGLAGGTGNRLKKIRRKYKKLEGIEADLQEIEESIKAQAQFSKDAARIIDNIFGEGTVRKYFRKFYEKDPAFMPDVDCFTDFLEQITPVMEKLSKERYL